MAYITTERVAEIRKELKSLFPHFKFSVSRPDHSTVKIKILEAPMMLTDKPYENVNVYHVNSIEDAEKRSIMEIIVGIASQGVKYHETGDYGTQPSHYSDVSIGYWNEPFRMVVKNSKGKPVAAFKVKEVVNA